MSTGTVKEIRWAGPYTNGEIPLPFGFKFDSTDIDFSQSVFSIEATLVDDDGSEMAFAGTVVWDDDTVGSAIVQLGAADVAVPSGKLVITRRLMIWAGDNVNRVASVEIKYNCHPAVGTPPAI